MDESTSDKFRFCEGIIEKMLRDELGSSSSSQRNDSIKECVQKLEEISEWVEKQAIYSGNEQVEDLPTSSLQLLLLYAYLGYAIEEMNIEREKRTVYLKAARMRYRQFLEVVSSYEIISFKLPWLNKESDQPTASSSSNKETFESAAAQREQKIARLNQIKYLEEMLVKLKLEQSRNCDEATQRETLFVLIRLWAIRAVAQLEKLEEELKILEYFEASKGKHSHDEEKPQQAGPGLKTFTIAKTEEQKKVFGLGYPSIPTVTVDEWFTTLQAKNGFGQQQQTANLRMGRDDEEEVDDEETEEGRKKKMDQDEWKDDHRRGWGNTYNKG